MGTYDTLVDGEVSAQVKCFECAMIMYLVGDKVPCDGSFIIMLPPREGARYAIIKDGVFVGLTDCPPVIIDKWGKHLISYDDFEDPHEKLVQSLTSKAKTK